MKHTQGDYTVRDRYYVVYSQDDEDDTGKGWYYQDTYRKGWPCSELFETEMDLLNAIKKATE